MVAVTSLLLAGDPVADATTGRILDAARDELLAYGLRRFSVEDVARRAGINRITIYRRFASKDDLLRAVILREGRELLVAVDAAVASVPDAADQIVEGFVAALMGLRRHPLVVRMLDAEPELFAGLLIAHGGAVIALARAYLADHARSAQRSGAMKGYDPDVVAELAVRLSLSLVLTPDSCIPLTTDDEARAFARQYLVPALRRSR